LSDCIFHLWKEFELVFADIKTDNINSFLSAAKIKPRRETMTRTKYLFRVGKGVHRIHTGLHKVSEKVFRG